MIIIIIILIIIIIISTKAQVPEENETPAEVKNIFQAAKLVFASVSADPGDFSNRLQ